MNGVKTSATTSGNASPGSTLNIGRESSDRQFSGGIAVVRVYNTALTDAEVTSNFGALRARFGV